MNSFLSMSAHLPYMKNTETMPADFSMLVLWSTDKHPGF